MQSELKREVTKVVGIYTICFTFRTMHFDYFALFMGLIVSITPQV